MKVIASFDDGAKADLRVAELLSKYNIEATFYVPSFWQSYNLLQQREPMSHTELYDLSRSFKIGSHSRTHPMLTRITKNEAFKEIFESKQELQMLLGGNYEVESFAYPKGYAHEHHKDMVRKVYGAGRNVQVGYITESPDPAWQSTSVHVAGNGRKEYKGSHWLKEALKLLEAAKAKKNSLFHFWGHSWEIDKFKEWDNFELLLKEVR